MSNNYIIKNITLKSDYNHLVPIYTNKCNHRLL